MHKVKKKLSFVFKYTYHKGWWYEVITVYLLLFFGIQVKNVVYTT
jgi:hypothetical protein